MLDPQKTIEGLQALYDLFSPPGTWGQKFYYGERVDPVTHELIRTDTYVSFNPKVHTCFCLEGAMVYGLDLSSQQYVAVRDALEAQLPVMDDGGKYHIVQWNDRPGRTQDEVLMLIQRAKDAEEAKAH